MVSESPEQRPRVGVTVLVLKEGKVLLGRRIGSKPGTGMYQTPGGHLEHQESFDECIKRELREEVGIEIDQVAFLGVTNVRQFPPNHFVLVAFAAEWKSGEVQNREPDKCEEWGWYDRQHLPLPMTPATESAIKSFLKQGSVFEATSDGTRTCYV